MGAVKEMLYDCLEVGLVPVDERSVQEWSGRLGESAWLLDGMPMTHCFETRSGELEDVPVIPIAVARAIGDILPDTYDTLGWIVELAPEVQA